MSAKHWDGKSERRIQERREGWCNGVCTLHDTIQDSSREHRDLVCGKINALRVETENNVKRIDEEIKDVVSDIKEIRRSIVGKYWFHVVVAGLCFGIMYVGFQQHWAFTKILSNQSEFSVQMNQIENNQIVIKEKVRSLEEAHKGGLK
jgi:hypothetical protein